MYSSCIHAFGHRHHWLAFIDSDEFIEYVDMDRDAALADVLRDYERPDVGRSLFIQRRLFANRNQSIVSRPPGGTVRGLTDCFPLQDNVEPYHDHRHGKTISRPRRALEADVHVECLQPRYHVVDELNREIGQVPILDRHSSQRFWLNHYVSRSVEQNEAKTRRGSGDLGTKQRAFFDYADSGAISTCSSARTRMITAACGLIEVCCHNPGVPVRRRFMRMLQLADVR